MDRPISDAARRSLRVRRVLGLALPASAAALILLLLPGWIRPTLARARIRTAVVTVGPLDQVITASGTVVPEIERVIASPIDARLLRVLRRPGTPVRTGEPIVSLDTAESLLLFERLTTDVRISENQQAQATVTLERSLADLDGHIERKALELTQLEEKAASAAQLFSGGLVAHQALRDAELAVAQAAIELAQLRTERTYAQRSTDLQSLGLSLQRSALERSAAEAGRVLQLATMTADRDGVLTWVVSQEGTLLRRGDMVARIADLRSFRVDASLSDVHGTQVRAGMPVAVRVNQIALAGHIADVMPAVENDAVRFTVTLDDASHAALRSNLRVDVLVITNRTPRTLKVAQGPFSDNAVGRGPVFVVRGNRAARVDVTFGLRGYDDIEIAGGLHDGDEVIISDMRDYAHLEEVWIE